MNFGQMLDLLKNGGVDNRMVPWVASQTDMLAEDWEEVYV